MSGTHSSDASSAVLIAELVTARARVAELEAQVARLALADSTSCDRIFALEAELACAAADQRALLRVSRAAKAFRDWDAIGALLSGDEPHAEDAQNDLRELDAALSRAGSAELGCEIAYRREPTQADGDRILALEAELAEALRQRDDCS